MNNESLEDEPMFRIGAVSRQTGVPTDTLRAWERRYQVVAPSRNEGRNRLYSQEDINRLSLLKRLVDSGFAIGTVAALPLELLKERCYELDRGQVRSSGDQQECRLLLVGDTLPKLVAERVPKFLSVAASFHSLDQIGSEASLPEADVLVYESPTLQEQGARELVARLNSLGDFATVVVYGFASRDALSALAVAGVQTIKAPADASELQLLCLELTGATRLLARDWIESGQLSPDLVPHIYTREQLGNFAAMSTAVKCECPQHLADLVLGLDAFEQYTLECESLNPDDVALHMRLHVATVKARAIMESALQDVVRSEGLDV